ncbi:hypothetical protein WOLCODRAFT_64515 [Wolfiporia cocos MD-104 SS10]|uniref:Transcription factor IIIC 90kDa subunit N-terminal domain-containing protein n=1 Tax=Wolfiporia cocos (strain MD-104) TaxID=742152 RepID=A0A2H3J6U6_WOLCO|nr:hypothetical protein WOLCODRAFT_64515 [Wolfiporia cocos MD-104 SS10]
MLQDPKATLSLKGKARDDAQFQLGWWDAAHLLEPTRRPLAWAKSSVIFTAHLVEPLVIARHFPSSQEFILPAPTPILKEPSKFDPLTIVSASPTDDWLFAYFPGRGSDGLGCLWRRGPGVDTWQARDSWPCPLGAGVIAVEWTVAPREWIISDSGSHRLPPRGPALPIATSLLLCVTQNHYVNLCFLPQHPGPARVVRLPLLQHNNSPEGPQAPNTSAVNLSDGQSTCVKAAFCLGYNESSVLIATRSHTLPLAGAHSSSFNAMDLHMSIGMPSEAPFSPEWESWGEETTINVCEINVSWKNGWCAVVSRPISQIHDASGHLTDLLFVTLPPSIPSAPSTPRSPRKGANVDTTARYLIASFLDFGDYTANPKSRMSVYSFSKTGSSPNNAHHSSWRWHAETQQSYDDQIVNFILPSMSKDGLLAGFLNMSGSVPFAKQADQDITIGRLSVMKLPDLTPDDRWEDAPLKSRAVRAGRDVPANIAYSPNRSLLCSIPSSTMLDSHTSIHALPQKHHTDTASAAADVAVAIATAILSRIPPNDVIHGLTKPAVSVEKVIDTLCRVEALLRQAAYQPQEFWFDTMLGIAAEIYLMKSHHASKDTDKQTYVDRAHAARDICSLSACCSAFEQCREEFTPSLDAVWNLIGLSSWLTEFIEALLKECVIVGDASPTTSSQTGTGNQVAPGSRSPSALFIHLSHPYPLDKLQKAAAHVKKFRDYISSLSASGENAQIAKDALLDVVDCSGVDLDHFQRVLGEVMQDLKQITNSKPAWHDDLSLAELICM